MKRLFLSLMVAVMSISFIVPDVQAKRLGGGGSAGMKRSLPARTPEPANNQGFQQAAPTAPAAPAAPSVNPGMGAAGATAAAAAPRRSWMGPIAGLAAGLGIAALASHLGFGEGLANFMMLALLAIVAVVVIRMLMARFAGNRPMATMNRKPGDLSFQGAGPFSANELPKAEPSFGQPAGASVNASTAAGPAFGSSSTNAAPVGQAAAHSFTLPPGFDVPAFERLAKMIFIRMQAANDAGDLNDLRQFTTPEMFASVKLDLQERGSQSQTTDVVKLDTEVLDIARENSHQVVSVRYHGLIREEKDGVAAPFDEVWHLVKPDDGSREWAIAGIAQYA